MKVCIIGAGVIGLTTAYALSRRGHEVCMVDAAHTPGGGASSGNGAQLSYSYVAPLADETVWKNLPKYLLSPDSPLTLRPAFDAAQWSWVVQFLAACRKSTARQTTASLLQLAFLSRDRLDAMCRDLPLDFAHRTAGKLVLYGSADALAAAGRQADFQRGLGCEQAVLDMAGCIKVEPQLALHARKWVGGIHTPSEQVGDCAAFCAQLADALSARSVAFQSGTRVKGFARAGNHISALQTSAGDIAADHFILANGTGSAALAKHLGLTLRVYPLKGYSVTLEAANEADLPAVSITDAPNKVVYARLGKRLRVAGRVEIVGHDLRIDSARCAALAQAAQTLFPKLADTGRQDISPWAGLRPATPTGLPIIGRSPLRNLHFNTGHGALGWTLACGSAELLARELCGEPAPIDRQAFSYSI